MDEVSKRGKIEVMLFLSAIISGIVFLVSLFWWNANSDYYSYDESMRWCLFIFISLAISIILFIIWFVMTSKTMKEDKGKWLDTAFNEYNIKNEDIKFVLKKSSIEFINKELLYTKHKRLFYLEVNKNTNESKMIEIKLNDILKLDLECTTLEHNRKRIIALTTTYDNIKSITDVRVKIITEDKIYSIELDKTKESVDKATQFKLTLDRELKALNQ